ncbi:hypothetical protein ABZ897_55760 [Nonomuraea sp. NPDC046802]|uniref:hypothetical protein n=1 Tax=Nonomuraea sp. NPDC046802 TaxID=3154919 RepID=UPI003411CFF9
MAMPSRVLTEPRELIIEAVAAAEPALKVGWIAAAVDRSPILGRSFGDWPLHWRRTPTCSPAAGPKVRA